MNGLPPGPGPFPPQVFMHPQGLPSGVASPIPQHAAPVMPEPPHVCMSGSISCSGIIPCQPCEMAVRAWVFPYGLAALGLQSNNPQMAQAIEAFYKGIVQGWQAFQTRMVQDPNLQATLRFTDVDAFNKFNAMLAEQMVNSVAPQNVPQSVPSNPEPPPPPSDPELAAAQAALGPDGRGKVTSDQIERLLKDQDEKKRKRARGMTSEMDAEEIAATRGGVVLGNVMTVPKDGT